jgi:tetratricopeptide (TPR) repeat protein
MPCVSSPRQGAGAVGTASVDDGGDLLHLALGNPREARHRAEALIRDGADPRTESIAHQTLGIVLRDQGRDAEALPELRAALRLARRTGDTQRVADTAASLGAAHVMAGSTKVGLAHLSGAVKIASGETLSRVRMRYAFALHLVGRHRAAADELARALPGIRRAGDPIWEARALNSRAMINLAIGETARAERDVLQARQIFVTQGQALEANFALHNLGVIAYANNDYPTALERLVDAAAEYKRLDMSSPDLMFDRALVFMSAGLSADAVAAIDEAVAEPDMHPTKQAELLLMSASALLADAQDSQAKERALRAAELFHQQRRPFWESRARLVSIQARLAKGDVDLRLLGEARRLTRQLGAERTDDAASARLVAAQIAVKLSHPARTTLLAAAAEDRTATSSLARINGWVAHVLLCEETDPRRLARACSRGFAEVDQFLASFGSYEARATSTSRGRELAAVAVRHAARTGRARDLLRASEQWRSVATVTTSVVPEHATVDRELAALRHVKRQIAEAPASDVSAIESLTREQVGLERAVRAKKLMLSPGHERTPNLLLVQLMDELGDSSFVELVDVDGELYAVVVAGRKVRKARIGTTAAAFRAVNTAHFTIHGIAHSVPLPFGGSVGQDLERALLGKAVGLVGDGPVVLSPPATLHAAPWSLLPTLSQRPFSVTPSATMWLRARRAAPPQQNRVVLICGPQLKAGPVEVQRLSRLYDDAVHLQGSEATVEAAVRAVQGAGLVHIATHGHFRRDNPMFSSLSLWDGDLTVHDLDRMSAPPYRIVLSACDSGVGAPVGAEQILGLQSALIALGTAGVASSVTKVNDRATMPLMMALHEQLRDGADLPTALAAARGRLGASELDRATAASFTAFGV